MLNKDGKLQLYNGNVKNNFYYGDKIQFHPSYKEDESDISSSADIFVENYIKMLQDVNMIRTAGTILRGALEKFLLN